MRQFHCRDGTLLPSRRGAFDNNQYIYIYIYIYIYDGYRNGIITKPVCLCQSVMVVFGLLIAEFNFDICKSEKAVLYYSHFLTTSQCVWS